MGRYIPAFTVIMIIKGQPLRLESPLRLSPLHYGGGLDDKYLIINIVVAVCLYAGGYRWAVLWPVSLRPICFRECLSV